MYAVKFASDKSCFPGYADLKDKAIPGCSRCGKMSKGASFEEFLEGGRVGRSMAVFRFSCGCDGRKLVVTQIWPTWRLLAEKSPGVWTAAKRTDEEKEKACSQQ